MIFFCNGYDFNFDFWIFTSSVSGLGFLACFSQSTPTPWVFPLNSTLMSPDLRFGKNIKNITESTYTERDVEWLREDLELIE